MQSRLLCRVVQVLPCLLMLPTLAMAVLPSNADVEAILDKHLIANKQAKGVAVALVDASGIRIVTAGVARGDSVVRQDDLFEIGSLTKTFTGLLLAIADRKGEAKLDDAVEKFLPNGQHLRDSLGTPIRMVDLATHRSGLPRLATNMQPKDPKDPYADYTEQDLLDFLKSLKATRERNAQYEYSNIGFGLLGYVLTRAANAQNYETLLSTRILIPLGMNNTTSDAKKFAARLAQPHDASGHATPAWALPIVHAGAGAIRATIGDMGRYVEAIAGVKPTPLDRDIALALTMREPGPGRINPIGLAWMKIPLADREFFNHDGGTFGSSSSMLVDRSTKEGVIVVANSSTKLTDIAIHLMDRRHNLAPRVFPVTVPIAEALLIRYAGNYKLNDQLSIAIRVNGSKITAQATGQGEFEIFPENETRFFAKVAPIVVTFGEIIDGRAGQFVLEQGGAKLIARRVS